MKTSVLIPATARRECQNAKLWIRLLSGGDDRPPRVPGMTLIYELHVRGFTMRHSQLPPELRGTYAGLGCGVIVDYLKALGVTAVELLPIHYFTDERLLLDQGLRNYWGYSTLGYFAPNPRYAASDNPVAEFKSMVKTLHSAGIEVILDVVYNHTAEGNQLGPTLNFKGIDNAVYYRLSPEHPRYYMDYTGCGNTLNASVCCNWSWTACATGRKRCMLMVFALIWLQRLGAETDGEIDEGGAFMDVIQQDPRYCHKSN